MPFEYPYTQSLFRKSGYLHVGEIYTSKAVGLKPHKKIPPHVWLQKWSFRVVNHATVYLICIFFYYRKRALNHQRK